jgi:tRNA1(Val) A37 N6-methylase TrmN6
MNADEEWTDDAVLDGRLRLKQPRRGHRFGHDAILLAAATDARPGERAVELGAGVGAAGLALALRVPGLAVTLVEIDPALAALACENAARNGLADRVSALALDATAGAGAFAAQGLAANAWNRVLMNPPFNDPARPQSPDAARRGAHVGSCSLGPWVKTAARLLRPKGVLTLIYPADRLPELLALGSGFGALTLLPVHAKPGAPAIRILLRATKGSRAPLAILPGLLLGGEDGRPTAEAETVLRGGSMLGLMRD